MYCLTHGAARTAIYLRIRTALYGRVATTARQDLTYVTALLKSCDASSQGASYEIEVGHGGAASVFVFADTGRQYRKRRTSLKKIVRELKGVPVTDLPLDDSFRPSFDGSCLLGPREATLAPRSGIPVER